MGIGHVFSYLTGGGTAPGRPAGRSDTAPSAPPIDEILEAEIVQLSLNSEGIWQATASPRTEPDSTQTAAHRYPHPRQLSSAGVRSYLPTGHAHVHTPALGLTVDLYV